MIANAENVDMTEKEFDEITDAIIGSAIKVHQSLGPGLLESTYEACMAFELIECGLSVERQKPLPVVYRAVMLDCGYRIDMLVQRAVIVEFKAVERLLPIHEAQILSYLKLSGCKAGLLINFNVRMLKDGVKRIVNSFPETPRTRRAPR